MKPEALVPRVIQEFPLPVRAMPIFMALFVAALSGCGTVAGNPKKPDSGGTPGDTPGRGAFQADLPLIDFDIADTTFGAGLALTGAQDGDGASSLAASSLTAFSLAASYGSERALFNAYGRRLNGIVRELNATSKRVNALVKAHGEGVGEGEGGGRGGKKLRFRNKGRSSRLSARIEEISVGPHDRQGVLCASGKPYQVLRWSTRATDVELWRDFRVAQGQGESKLAVVTRLRAKSARGGALALDLATTGTWNDADEDADEGRGLVERLLARKETNGTLTLRAVTDRFAGATPSTFRGDAYMVGRLVPLGAGRKGYDPSFVAYSSSARRPGCQAGFEENAPDLWSPGFMGPRFCLARAEGGASLATQDAFRAHVASFESIGLAPESGLTEVGLPAGTSCD